MMFFIQQGKCGVFIEVTVKFEKDLKRKKKIVSYVHKIIVFIIAEKLQKLYRGLTFYYIILFNFI